MVDPVRRSIPPFRLIVAFRARDGNAGPQPGTDGLSPETGTVVSVDSLLPNAVAVGDRWACVLTAT